MTGKLSMLRTSNNLRQIALWLSNCPELNLLLKDAPGSIIDSLSRNYS